MKITRLAFLSVFLSSVFFSCKKDFDNSSALNADASSNLKQNEGKQFIVIFKEGESVESASKSVSLLSAKSMVIKKTYPELGLMVVRTSDPAFPDKARGLSSVQAVAADTIMNMLPPTETVKFDPAMVKSKLPAISNPFSYLQWGLTSVNAYDAWDKGYKGNKAVVAVLDGGFYVNDPEIAPNVIGTHSFVDGESVEFSGTGFSHGTHVAGIIAAADNKAGVVGEAPKAKLLLIKVLNDAGHGSFTALMDGVLYATVHGANVINMSLGGYLRDKLDLVEALNRTMRFARSSGVTIFAAAGNDDYNMNGYPAYGFYPSACDGVNAVSATGPLGWALDQSTNLYKFASYSNYGDYVDFAAPGGNLGNNPSTRTVTVGFVAAPAYVFNFVLSTGYYDGANYGYIWAAGTSMASPYAAAAAALVYGKYSGKVSPPTVEFILRKSVYKAASPLNKGNGDINAGKAVDY